MAEGFGLQTLQEGSAHDKTRYMQIVSSQGPDLGKTEAGPDVTTRRVVAPKPGLVYQKSE